MNKIICVAGFGDDASMFAPLVEAAADSVSQYYPISLPGFGSPIPEDQTTSLESLATFLIAKAAEIGADTVLAHSVASIIASIAATRPNSPLTSIISLEGNLTPEDAYFSGTAAQYSDPGEFRTAFLDRLDRMATNDEIIARYRGVVEHADPKALWELGCDAHDFSNKQSPGDRLQTVANTAYLYNPENLPGTSLSWLEKNELFKLKLPGASHWASLDQPHLLARVIEDILVGWTRA